MAVATAITPAAAQVDFTSSTIIVYLSLALTGSYVLGGSVSGIQAYLATLGINSSVGRLMSAEIYSIAQQATGTNNQYLYKYIAASDNIQIIQLGATTEELPAGALPAAVTGDTIMAQMIYQRL